MKTKTILIQGAMDIELDYFIKHLDSPKHTCIAGYDFYEGIINELNIVISKTFIGTINATTATTIGITTFNPDIIINQGIAGAHRTNLHTGDIIIGEKCCNINSYSMPSKSKGEGCNPFEWEPDKRAKSIKYANEKLVDLFYKKLSFINNKKIYIGTLGSGDVFNREVDRINWITDIFENLCEDMESIGTYSVCNNFNIPCIGIRIISNNELLLEDLNENKAFELQKIILDTLTNLK